MFLQTVYNSLCQNEQRNSEMKNDFYIKKKKLEW